MYGYAAACAGVSVCACACPRQHHSPTQLLDQLGFCWLCGSAGFGFVQVLFLMFAYAYVLFFASNMISDGSELLLLVPSMRGEMSIPFRFDCQLP